MKTEQEITDEINRLLERPVGMWLSEIEKGQISTGIHYLRWVLNK